MHRLELEDWKVKGNMFIDYSEEEYNKDSFTKLKQIPLPPLTYCKHTI